MMPEIDGRLIITPHGLEHRNAVLGAEDSSLRSISTTGPIPAPVISISSTPAPPPRGVVEEHIQPAVSGRRSARPWLRASASRETSAFTKSASRA